MHALLELPLVRIGVTGGAIQILPVINGRRLLAQLRRVLMTFAAGDSLMSTCKDEAGLLMPSQRERRWPISIHGVALLALVHVRRGCKLSCMTVSVTVGANLKLDLVERVLPFRNMTLRTLKASMAPHQGIGSGRVFLHSELGRFESFHRMAGGALPAIRSFRKLPVMRIGFVAIRTLLKNNGFLEIPLRVALYALYLRVLSEQRIFRF